MSTSMPDPYLAHALSFTAEDLAANRNGYLTKRQQDIFIRTRKPRRLLILFLLNVGTLIALYFVTQPIPTDAKWATTATSFGIFGGLALLCQLIWSNVDKDVAENKVDSLTGQVRKSSHLVDRYRMYTIQIADRKFGVLHGVYNAFQESRYYCIYYAPRTRTILSAEPMIDE